MSKRRDADITPQLPIWRKVKRDVYCASPNDVQRVVSDSKLSDDEIKKRMGAGYALLLRALEGQLLTDSDIRFIESCLGQLKFPNSPGNTNLLGERLTSKYPGK